MSSHPARSLCPQCGSPLPADAPAGLCPQCLLRQGLVSGTQSTAPVSEQPAGSSASPAGAFTPPEPAELAIQLPQFEILEILGRGGMGAVYKARQPTLDRLVAVKILPPHVAAAPGFAERFQREARALARLNHPNIIAIHDFGRTREGQGAGLYYLVMEYVDGASLRHLIESGELKPKEALGIVGQICEALQFAHDEGIVHRDIKPDNILIDKKGRVKIADFGIAKLMGEAREDSRLTREGEAVGTPQYMAPEQLEGGHGVDHRADIYSLGVVFYEMLTGELPVGRFALPSRKVEVDVRLDEVVLRALERQPERRYQKAIEVKTEVDFIRSAPAVPAPVPVPVPAAALGAGQAAAGAGQVAVPSELDPRAQVKGPGTGLLVTGILNWVTAVLLFSLPVVMGVPRWLEAISEQAFVGIATAVFILTTMMIYGAFKMMQLEARGLAITAGLLAMLVSPGNLVGLPMGIWALVVLHRPDVRAAFTARQRLRT